MIKTPDRFWIGLVVVGLVLLIIGIWVWYDDVFHWYQVMQKP